MTRAADGAAVSDHGRSPMDIAILIVSYKSRSDIAQCLAALAKSTYAAFRVVIVENGGEDAWRDLQAANFTLPGRQAITLVKASHNLGFAGGVNLAYQHAGPADAFWILNPDTEPYPDALEAMVRRLSKGDCSAVGHDIVLPSGRLACRGGIWETWVARAVSIDNGKPYSRAAHPDDVERRTTYLIGASALVSAGFMQRVGPMREDYFLYCEEVEWFLRAGRSGEKLGYAPDAVVFHAHGTATGAGGHLKDRSRLSTYLLERNRLLLTRDLFPSHMPVTLVLALLQFLVRYGKAGAWRQLGYGLAGLRAGLRDERGPPAWFA